MRTLSQEDEVEIAVHVTTMWCRYHVNSGEDLV